MPNYLAFDFGAESGRALLAKLHSGVLTVDEVHRFPNEPVTYSGSLHWDAPRLWLETRRALSSVAETRLAGIGVDTWGVDYALLGERGELIQNPYHYRDGRTHGIMEDVFQIVPQCEIYAATGIQFMQINTLFQLFAAKRDTPRLLATAERLITMPDLFHYWLTGNAVCEFTNATTSQMVDPRTRRWSTELLERLGLPSSLPGEIIEPGSIVGTLLPELGRSALAGTPVIAPATHDTGSAVAAISAREGTAFLSSGTWSLIGTEIDAPIITDDALRLNFTNEGGVCGTTRLLKNVVGLWMLQCCRRAWEAKGRDYDYRELMEVAGREPGFRHLVDPNHPSFLRPDDMPRAIDERCRKTGQPVPATPGAYARAVLESLAFKYRFVLQDLEKLTGRPIEQVRVIGGGSRNQFLNQFTANATGKRVLAGPAEATALGNVGMQMMATGATSSLRETRDIIERSFPTEIFEPCDTPAWDREAVRFQQYCEVQ
jgi:rhamnulokinase